MDWSIVALWIAFGIICSVIHKKKGYSPVAGFCWGFFLAIIGLIVVLLESTKEEHDSNLQDNKGLSIGHWFAIFLGIGLIGIIMFLVVINHI